ncbi:aminoglycoside phosphotransferase family protein [Paenibacillus sp. GD4]|nr:aminoglycoside phosphotransferase family protein [Paenibacillus sp. GD4]MDQ1912667.1 aminoglycoside phosphotransferase family protein [Paenibacillus sp. GD4]
MIRDQDREFERVIRNCFPEVEIHTMEWLGEGMRSTALLINDEWVFRFPKSLQAADELGKEIQLLPRLIPHVKAAIPEFVHVGKQDNGMPFVGYRKLPGQLLGEDELPSLSDEAQNRLAAQIAVFMEEVSSFPVGWAREAGVPERCMKTDCINLWTDVQEQVFPRLDEALQRYIASRFESYLGNPDYFRYVPALIHGDLSPDHFLIDPNTGDLTGIIDFGDAVVCDRDYDYVYLLEDGGETFARQVMIYRGVADPDACIRKVSLWVTFDQLRYVLEGNQTGNQDWVEEGIDLLRQEMEEQC